MRVDLLSRPGRLHVTAGHGNDLYPAVNVNAGHFFRTVGGDFDIETSVEFLPSQRSFQGAGIFVWQDQRNFFRLERAVGGIGGGGQGVRLDRQMHGHFAMASGVGANPTSARQVELLVQRRGQQFFTFWREPGGPWRTVATLDLPMAAEVQVGVLVVVNCPGVEATADFFGLRVKSNAR